MSDKNYKKLLEDSRDYLHNECDILKLDFATKLAKVVGVMIMGFVLSLVAIVTIIFLSLALAQYLTAILPSGIAYTVVCCLYIALIVLMVSCRNAIIFRPLTRIVSGILLGGEVSGDIEEEIERLRADSDFKQEQIGQDMQDIKQDLQQPHTILSIFKYLPTVISVITTIMPLIRKFKFKK